MYATARGAPKPAPPSFANTGSGDALEHESLMVQQGTEDHYTAEANTAGPRVGSGTGKPEYTERRGKERKGDAALLADKHAVIFSTAEQYLGITERQRQKLMKCGALKGDEQGRNRKITTESLRKYLRPKNPN